MDEKETKSEMIKRLANESNEKRLTDTEREAAKERHFHLLYENLRFSENLEEMSKTMKPLANSMAELVLQSKQTLTAMKDSVQVYRNESEKAWNESQRAAENLKDAAHMMTWRLWVAVVLVGILSGPATLLTYNLWQKYFSTGKVETNLRRNAR
jgi:hypothetical protein